MGGFVGACSSAVLLIFALPPFGIVPFAFLALVPLARSISKLPPGYSGRRAAAILGGCFGIVFWGWSLMWVPLVVGSSFTWAVPGYLLQLALLGCLSGLFAWAAHGLHKGAALPLGLALPLAWVGVEWVKGHFPLGLAFPWLGLGVSLSGWPEILGLAEWFGEGGVAFWLAGVAGLVAMALQAPPGRGRTVPWALVLGVGLLPALAGALRAGSLSFSEGPRVLAVGTEVSPSLREDPSRAWDVSLAQIQEALTLAPPGPWDLVLLPEGAIPFPIGSLEGEEAMESIRTLAREVNAPFVAGALGWSTEETSEGQTNSVVLLFPEDPGIQRYDKVRLVPGMEAGAFVPGSGTRLFSAEGWEYGPLLCYESLYSGLARTARNAGGIVLLNLTSDVWFGRGDSLIGSLFLRQHPAHLVLRAVETRTPVARSANGGYSSLLSPLGEVVANSGQLGVGAVGGNLPVFSGTTLFSRTGDWIGPFCILLSFILLARPRKRQGPGRIRPTNRTRTDGP
ncbi:MAG: apolipoprotein N-acyltransferase [Gemmatimonadota bacterium]